MLKRMLLGIATVFVLAGAAVAGPLGDAWEAFDRKDYATAFQYFEAAADNGDATAQERLGYMYRFGLGVPQDYSKAVRWYQVAASQGYSKAQAYLGLMYEQDLENEDEAVRWYRDAAASDQEYQWEASRSILRLAAKGNKKAIEWVQKDGEQGNARSMIELGYLNQEGKFVPQNYILAHKWFNLASALGNTHGEAKRDEVAAAMTSDQIVEAQRMAREWMEEHRE